MCDNRPKVTVLMCVYNNAPYLATAIQSILSQTFTDFEFIILDDGSQDESAAIAQRFEKQDSRIRFYQNPENKGLQYSRNRCLELARGDYIAVQDGDDYSLPTRLEEQVNLLDADPETGIVGTWVQFISEDNQPLFLFKTSLFQPVAEHDKLRWVSFFHCPISHSCAMLRRDLAVKVGGYGSYPYAEDYDLIVRMLLYCNIRIVPRVLQYYRLNATSVTHSLTDEIKFQCSLEIAQKAIEQFLEAPVPMDLMEHVRRYSLIHRSTPSFITPRVSDVSGLSRDFINLYYQLYTKYLATFPVSKDARRFIQYDILYETSRFLLQLGWWNRLKLIADIRRKFPPAIWVRLMIRLLLIPNQQVFFHLVGLRFRMMGLLFPRDESLPYPIPSGTGDEGIHHRQAVNQ